MHCNILQYIIMYVYCMYILLYSLFWYEMSGFKPRQTHMSFAAVMNCVLIITANFKMSPVILLSPFWHTLSQWHDDGVQSKLLKAVWPQKGATFRVTKRWNEGATQTVPRAQHHTAALHPICRPDLLNKGWRKMGGSKLRKIVQQNTHRFLWMLLCFSLNSNAQLFYHAPKGWTLIFRDLKCKNCQFRKNPGWAHNLQKDQHGDSHFSTYFYRCGTTQLTSTDILCQVPPPPSLGFGLHGSNWARAPLLGDPMWHQFGSQVVSP